MNGLITIFFLGTFPRDARFTFILTHRRVQNALSRMSMESSQFMHAGRSCVTLYLSDILLLFVMSCDELVDSSGYFFGDMIRV